MTCRPGLLLLIVLGSLGALPPAQAEPVSPASQAGTIVTFDQSAQVQDRELITLFLVVAGLLVLIIRWREVAAVGRGRWLVAAYVALALGCLLTVLESVFLGDVLNLVEHVCYLACTCLVALFCWRTGMGKEESRG